VPADSGLNGPLYAMQEKAQSPCRGDFFSCVDTGRRQKCKRIKLKAIAPVGTKEQLAHNKEADWCCSYRPIGAAHTLEAISPAHTLGVNSASGTLGTMYGAHLQEGRGNSKKKANPKGE